MAGFTFRVSGGVTGRRAVAESLDRAPLLLLEDPDNESAEELAASLETQGIVYVREHGSADDVHPANTRAIIRILNAFGSDHAPRKEGEGNSKYVLYTTGTQEFAPGPANRIFMSPASNMLGNQNAIVFSGAREPGSEPSAVAGGMIDMMYLAGLRLPGVPAVSGYGIIPCLLDESGVHQPEKNCAQRGSFGIQSRFYNGTYLNPGGGPTITTGVMIPEGALLMAVGYQITTRGHTDTSDEYDIGVAGDLTRFAENLDSYVVANDVLHDAAASFRYYDTDTALVVTLDDVIAAGSGFQLKLWTCYFIFMSGTLSIPAA